VRDPPPAAMAAGQRTPTAPAGQRTPTGRGGIRETSPHRYLVIRRRRLDYQTVRFS